MLQIKENHLCIFVKQYFLYIAYFLYYLKTKKNKDKCQNKKKTF